MNDSTSSEDMRTWLRYLNCDPWEYWEVEERKWLYRTDGIQTSDETCTPPCVVAHPRKRLKFDSDSDSDNPEYPLEVFARPLERRKRQRDSDSESDRSRTEWPEYALMVFDVPDESEVELSPDLLPAQVHVALRKAQQHGMPYAKWWIGKQVQVCERPNSATRVA